MNEEYTLMVRSPNLKEYQKLRKAVGWWDVNPTAIEFGLHNSLFSICVIFEDEVIGCGRVVGDGGTYFYIQDVIVLPEHQKKGIGKCIMDAIMEFFKENAHSGAFIGLMAARGISKFYEQYGFSNRPADKPGMFLVWDM